MTPLETRIAAIKSDCEERLPDLPRFGGEARARRAVLAAINSNLELAAIPTHQDCPAENHAIACIAMEELRDIAEAWETP